MLKMTIQGGLPNTLRHICLNVVVNGDMLRGNLKSNSFSLKEEGNEPRMAKDSLIGSIGNQLEVVNHDLPKTNALPTKELIKSP